MRRAEQIQNELSYLQEFDNSPVGVNIVTLTAELLFDIREVLLDIAEKQGVDVESFFEEPCEEDVQLPDDDAGVSEVGDSEPPQDPADDGIPVGSDDWLADRAAQLRGGLHDLSNSQG